MYLLRVNDIDVGYEDMPVLHGVSLTVDKGELVTIVGSNGSGKTTLLRTISGILRPTSGQIYFLDERVDRKPPHRLVEMGIVHIPEGRELFPDLTVLENLVLGSYGPEAKKSRRETLEWVYRLFPFLKGRINQLAGTLSGGEQQMLAIGRGLMSKPNLLMLDEISSGLAPIMVRKVFDAVKELNNQGITVLMVEQNVYYGLNFASRAYVLENGRIVLEGKGKDLLAQQSIRQTYLGL